MHEVDAKIRRLELLLENLAGIWRGAYGDTEKQEQIVKQYHSTMIELYALGWDGILDFQSELPKDLMPQEHLQRHPYQPWKS